MKGKLSLRALAADSIGRDSRHLLAVTLLHEVPAVEFMFPTGQWQFYDPLVAIVTIEKDPRTNALSGYVNRTIRQAGFFTSGEIDRGNRIPLTALRLTAHRELSANLFTPAFGGQMKLSVAKRDGAATLWYDGSVITTGDHATATVRDEGLFRKVQPDQPLSTSLTFHQKWQQLDKEIKLLESATLVLKTAFENDAAQRASYSRAIQAMSQEVRAIFVNSGGALALEEATSYAVTNRNLIMEATRGRTSAIGQAIAKILKDEGKTLVELLEAKAAKWFKTPFKDLPPDKQRQIYLEILESAGRSNPTVNAVIKGLGKAGGRALPWICVGLIIYDVATAENKTKAVVQSAASLATTVAVTAVLGVSATAFAVGFAACLLVIVAIELLWPEAEPDLLWY